MMLTYGKSKYISNMVVKSLGRLGKHFKERDINIVLNHITSVKECRPEVLEDKDYLSSIKALYYTKTKKGVNIYHIDKASKEVYIDLYKHCDKQYWNSIYNVIMESNYS